MAAMFELVLLHLKPGTKPDEAGSEAHGHLLAAVKGMRDHSKVGRIFFGRQIEDPEIGVMVLQWPGGMDAALAFAASPGIGIFGQNVGTFMAEGTAPDLRHLTFVPDENDVSVFTAPATEVFTAYGAEPGFAANLAKFRDALHEAAGKDQLEGYISSGTGEITQELAQAPGDKPGKAVALIIGWTSREAHLNTKAKEGNAIIENLHLTKGGNTGTDMWHVALKEI